MLRKINGTAIIVLTLAVIAILGGMGALKNENEGMEELVIFHAGSLSVQFREISALFQKEHPEIIIKAEAAGSRSCARKISDLNRKCDVMASADYKVVANLLMPDHADFNIRFALNEMVIAYTDRSGRSDAISPENWHEILLEDDIFFGRSDPNLDPCGYRAMMVFQLAENHYGIVGLAERLKKKDKYIRPKETDMLALLEVGEIDYLFIYRSVAVQHGLKMILLPNEINLKSPALADSYRKATVQVTGKKLGEFIVRKGEPMVYSVTIPRRAPNPKAAQKWVELLLSPRGQAIMKKNGQPTIAPAIADGFEHLPQSIQPLCQKVPKK